MRTQGYRKLAIVVANMDAVDPDPTSSGPRLVEWVRSEQAHGKAVLAPAGYYKGTVDGVSPSYFVSVDPREADALTHLGIWHRLPAQ